MVGGGWEGAPRWDPAAGHGSAPGGGAESAGAMAIEAARMVPHPPGTPPPPALRPMPRLFALVDCASFYVSCERLFDPALARRPVVVLSNNDGCVIARSEEAEALGVPMGAPFFQWRRRLEAAGVAVLSSNYALYADLSRRVMETLETLAPE